MSTIAATDATAYRALLREVLDLPQAGGPSPVHAFVVAMPGLVTTLSGWAGAGPLPPVVHVEQDVVVHDPSGLDAPVPPSATVVGARPGLAGTRVVIEGAVGRAVDGGPAATLKTALLLVGHRRPAEGSLPKRSVPKLTEAATFVDVAIDRGLPARYAEAAGDHNPIHLDTELAGLAGFPDVVLHGMCVLALACEHAVAVHAADDAGRVRRVGGRFTGVVHPGDLLRIETEAITPSGVGLRVRTPRGVAVSNGWLELVPTGSDREDHDV